MSILAVHKVYSPQNFPPVRYVNLLSVSQKANLQYVQSTPMLR